MCCGWKYVCLVVGSLPFYLGLNAQITQTLQHTIFLTSTSSLYELSGRVTQSNVNADSVKVFLYREQIQGGVELVDSVLSFNKGGEYSFPRMTQGNYYLKAVSLDKNYLNTYYGNSPIWISSNAIVLRQDMRNRDINLISRNDVMGSAKLSGRIEYGSTDPFSTPGSPAENIDVVLLQNNSVVAITQTNTLGQYSFKNLPIMSFDLIVDIPGKSTSGEKVAFNSSKRSIENVNFSIEKSTIDRINNTSLNEQQEEPETAKAYPNPFTQNLTLQTEEFAKYKIIDLTGKTILQGEVDGLKPIHVEELQRGNYFVLFESDSGYHVIKITKQ